MIIFGEINRTVITTKYDGTNESGILIAKMPTENSALYRRQLWMLSFARKISCGYRTRVFQT